MWYCVVTIKSHSSIALDLRDNCRKLGLSWYYTVGILWFHNPSPGLHLSAAKLQNHGLCTTNQCYTESIRCWSPYSSTKFCFYHWSIQRYFTGHPHYHHSETDYTIPLKPGSRPPNKRVHRVRYKQIYEVGKLIRTMLKESLIRQNSSPYSSPAILVRKRMKHGYECYLQAHLMKESPRSPFLSWVNNLTTNYFNTSILWCIVSVSVSFTPFLLGFMLV